MPLSDFLQEDISRELKKPMGKKKAKWATTFIPPLGESAGWGDRQDAEMGGTDREPDGKQG